MKIWRSAPANQIRRFRGLAVILLLVGATSTRAQLRVVTYASGFSAPIAFEQDPSNPAVQYVAEQRGVIRVISNGVVQTTPFLNISSLVVPSGGEQGLLGLAFPLDYATSGRFFVNYTRVADGRIVVARYRRSANPLVADPVGVVLVWSTGEDSIRHPFSNHNAGCMAFGPDGYLYISQGDGGSGGDPQNNAQNTSELLGKFLRIDVNVPDGHAQGFVVPPGNAGLPRPEIWSLGWRNPWKFSFDHPSRGGTGAMLVADVGQGLWEEIDYEPAGRGGRNYGWRFREGAHPYTGTTTLPLVDPIFEYGRSFGASITGGYVYRGAAIPTAYGRYFFGDYVTRRVWSLNLRVNSITGEAAPSTAADLVDHTAELGGTNIIGGISGFGLDAAGELYLINHSSGNILKVLGPPRAPRVISLARHNPATLTTSATSVVYRVTFNESVTGVDPSDFVLKSIGTLTGTIASVSGSGSSYEVTVNALSGVGVLQLDLRAAGTGIVNGAGNSITTGFFTGQTYQVGVTTAASWGRNGAGQLGNNSTSSSSLPVPVLTSGALSGKTVVALAGGEEHSVALAADGTVYTWGGNGNGQLGNGSLSSSEVPVAVTTSGVLNGRSIIAIAAGHSHTAVLASDGTVYTWGANSFGQLGNGTTSGSSVPVAVDTSGALSGKTVTAIAAAQNHTLALTSEGRVYAWGLNSTYGELGDGTNTNRSVPVAISAAGALYDKTIVAIAAGNSRSFALTSEGHLYAWGANVGGELGNGTNTSVNHPVAVAVSGALSGKTIVAVASGNAHTVALSSDNSLFAWGDNTLGQLGNNTGAGSNLPQAVQQSGVLSGRTIAAITTGATNSGSHLLALTSDGQTYSWGYNNHGQLGNNSTTNSNVPVSVNVAGTLNGLAVFSLGGGSFHSLVTTRDMIPPAAPTIAGINSDTGASATDGITADSTLVFSGSAEPNSSVTLSRTGLGVLGSTTANGNGAWSFDHTGTSLPVGAYTFTATATDAAGNISPASSSFPVAIQNAPAITTPLPVGGTFVAGDSFTISVVATGTPPLSYQWFRDGSPLSDSSNRTGSTTSSITHSQIGTVGFDGSYTVVVGNASGTVTSSPAIVVVNKAGQTITFPPIANRTPGSGPFTISATASTGFVVTLSVVSGPAMINGNTITLTGTGVVVIRASQAGDLNFNPATVERSFLVENPPPVLGFPGGGVIAPSASIVLGNLAPTFNGSPHPVSATTTPPGLVVTITYNGSASPPTNAGTYLVSAAVNEFGFAANATGTLVIAKATQTVSFAEIPGGAVGVPIGLNAAASSGLPITYSLVSGNATLGAATLTLLDANPVVVRATQAGNENVVTAFADQITSATKMAQSISFPALADRARESAPLILDARASSGLPVTYVVTCGPATITGNLLTLTGTPGTVVVRASQPGNSTFVAANDVERSFSVLTIDRGIYFGNVTSNNVKTGDLAATVAPEGNQGSLLVVAPTAGINAALDFTINSDGSFATTVVVNVAIPAVSDATLPSMVRAPATFTLRGSVLNGVLNASIDELGLSFSANVLPSSGPSAGAAGFYKSSVLGKDDGATYAVVGNHNQVLVLAAIPDAYIGGVTVLAADGTFSLQAGSDTTATTIQGTVNPAGSTLSGSISAAGKADVAFSGLSTTIRATDRLINLSSRVRVGSGDRVLIAGFVVAGAQPKQVLVRAIGPALGGFGLQEVLPNPRITVFRDTEIVAENDDWSASSNPSLAATFIRLGAFNLPVGSRDAAVVVTLPPGAYGAQIDGNGGSGVALVEIYDASPNPAAESQRIMNISTRGEAGPGESSLIAGFVVSGNAPKKLLVRGIGPGLLAFGVSGVLLDPRLRLYRDAALVAENDNWSGSATEATAAAEAARVTGAFSLAAGSRDASLVLTLVPGTYSLQVTGPDGTTTGVALAEIYEIANVGGN